MDKAITFRISKMSPLLPLLSTAFIILISCGGENQNASTPPEGPKGSIVFSLHFLNAQTKSRQLATPEDDICESYGIDTITAVIRDARGVDIASGSWPCEAHEARMSGIPVSNGLILVVEAIVSGNILYRGEVKDIEIIPNQNIDVGPITMISVAIVNEAPVADAGPDQTVNEGAMVTLNGVNSIDVDDGIASFEWIQIQGAQVVLATSDEPKTSFIAPDVGMQGAALEFSLAVTDYSGDSSFDSCIINVAWINEPPNADAGADQTVDEGVMVHLDASNSDDPDDGIDTYLWTQVSGPPVDLSDQTSAAPSFRSPYVGTQGAVTTFQVTVSDISGLQDTDSCVVNVSHVNAPPVADAGPNQNVVSGETVVLNGSQSWDAEDSIITYYQWNQTDGIPVALSDPTGQVTSFVAPEAWETDLQLRFRLTVKDSDGLAGTDTCQINVIHEDDTIFPTVKIEHPQNNVTSNKFVDFSGTAWDNREVIAVLWSNDVGGSGIAVGTTQWSVHHIKLNVGVNTIIITAYDSSGNQGSASKNLIYVK